MDTFHNHKRDHRTQQQNQNNRFHRTDLQLHGDRDLRLMSMLESESNGVSEENIKVESHPGGGACSSVQVATHNALQNT